MARLRTWTALVLLALAGCTDSSRLCKQIDDEAEALRARLAACDPGDPGSCVLERMSGGACLHSFRCSVALNRDWQQLDSQGLVAQLERERRACGGSCEYILCASDEGRSAACNPTSRRCELVQDTDAGSH